jgi:hypothetical protein
MERVGAAPASRQPGPPLQSSYGGIEIAVNGEDEAPIDLPWRHPETCDRAPALKSEPPENALSGEYDAMNATTPASAPLDSY